jgi:hypothetical protein
MSGSIILAFILGSLLMLVLNFYKNGKIHFGYIYGFCVFGTLGIYCVMNFLA